MALIPEAPRATVLVVDDNEANRSLALHTLEDEGYRVVLASGGEEAIALVEREVPDCIVLDVRMPGLDGFAVCERIRSLPRAAETPVVFLTASRDVETFDLALRSGGDDFLTKPVRPTELVIRVQSALKLRRLSTELREHYSRFKSQRDDMVRLQLQKERLMAFVVHDLKNPVNAMDLHAQILARDQALSDDARESAVQIRGAARQLNRMILNLLDLSKADEGKLTVTRADVALRPLVDAVTGEIALAARERDVTCEVALETDRVLADEDLLRRTLANLVENAIHHAPRRTVVRVLGRRGDGATELRVVDGGTGVPSSMREQIFDPFVQLEGNGLPSSRSGRGLGLTFCRLAVEAHGGRIWIEDANPGAIFALRIPDAG
jgi:two-component system sensor histidine kinase/response regulator